MSMQDFSSLIRFETQQSQHIQKVSQRDPSGEYHGACLQSPDPLHQNYLVLQLSPVSMSRCTVQSLREPEDYWNREVELQFWWDQSSFARKYR